jgi:hypothetical protein
VNVCTNSIALSKDAKSGLAGGSSKYKITQSCGSDSGDDQRENSYRCVGGTPKTATAQAFKGVCQQYRGNQTAVECQNAGCGSPPNPGSGGLSTGALIGIVAGAIIAVALIVGVSVGLVKKKKDVAKASITQAQLKFIQARLAKPAPAHTAAHAATTHPSKRKKSIN